MKYRGSSAAGYNRGPTAQSESLGVIWCQGLASVVATTGALITEPRLT